MQVSKNSYRLLKWFVSNGNRGLNVWQIQKQFDNNVEYEVLNYLHKKEYLDCWEPPNMDPPRDDYSPPAYEFRVSDYGKAYIEHHKEAVFDTLVTRGLAIAAIVISLISLLLQI